MRRIVVLIALSTFVAACDSTPRIEEKAPEKKKLSEMKQAGADKATPEELEEARRKAGFRSPEDARAEATAKYVLDSKIYVKGRLADYRKLLDDIRKQLDEVEKAAPKWAKAKDGQAALDSWNEKYKKEASKVTKFHDELTAKGTEGGDTEVAISAALQAWGNLRNDLAPDISANEGFKTALTDIRAKLDEIGKSLDDIEKDESVVAEPEAGADAKADANADAKADAKAG